MKKIAFTLLVALPLVMAAQQKSFMHLFEHYSGKDGFTTVDITQGMLRMMLSFAEDDEELSGMIGNISGIRIVVCHLYDEDFVEDMNKMIDRAPYQLISTINESGQQTKFFNIEKNKKTTEFLMVSYGRSENLVVNITGNIDVNKISRLSQFNINGMDKVYVEPGDSARSKRHR
ncbi:MAG: DUF4252 domain-containing protein [Bacteroidales bacterium]|nr:DUF4252 domain-containing protein [Bacteroidales bacterium]